MHNSSNNRFSVEVTSVPDRDALVAEMWLERELFAELRYEHRSLRLQFYPAPDGKPWDVPYEEFAGMLEQAREKLGAPRD